MSVIREMRAADLPVDLVTVPAFVDRHARIAAGQPRVALRSWLAGIATDVPVPSSACWYADIVVEQSVRRAALLVAAQIAAAAEGGSLAELDRLATDGLTAITATVAPAGC